MLGSGERPWTAPDAAPLDVVDVADLESEADHAYELLDARDNQEIAHAGTTPFGADVVDGGRTQRIAERFVAHLRPGSAARCIVRLDAAPGTEVRVLAGGEPAAAFEAGSEDGWEERSFDLPATTAGERTPIEVRFSGRVTTFHYWFVAPGDAPVTPG